MTDPSPTPAPPTSATAVARQLQWPQADIDDPAKLSRLDGTVAAVNAFVRRAGRTSPDEQALGAAMLGARLWRRRGNSEGKATYTADAVASAARSDPEVWMLLGLGTWAPPVVG